MHDSEVFIDTSGFFALLVQKDPTHKRAKELLRQLQVNKGYALTSDYVIDETLTLLKMCGVSHLSNTMLTVLEESKALCLAFISEARFNTAKTYYVKHLDQGFSFTDCTSFVLMKELKLARCMTTDMHFRIAGFDPLLSAN